MAGPGVPGPAPYPREHGSPRGYRQHIKYHEDPCPPCGLAQSEVDAKRYQLWRLTAAAKARRVRRGGGTP